MASVIPNKYIDLTKTNYFANLKKKAKSVKDVKEQEALNTEFLNCISLLESRIVRLEAALVSLADKHNNAMKAIANNIDILDRKIDDGGEPMDA